MAGEAQGESIGVTPAGGSVNFEGTGFSSDTIYDVYLVTPAGRRLRHRRNNVPVQQRTDKDGKFHLSMGRGELPEQSKGTWKLMMCWSGTKICWPADFDV